MEAVARGPISWEANIRTARFSTWALKMRGVARVDSRARLKPDDDSVRRLLAESYPLPPIGMAKSGVAAGCRLLEKAAALQPDRRRFPEAG